MKKNILSILSLLLISGPVLSANNDFNTVCGYFDKLHMELSNRQLSKIERRNYISSLVKKGLSSDSAARSAWEVVIYAVPEQRYDLYKTSAEETTNKKWQCDSMEKLIATAGE